MLPLDVGWNDVGSWSSLWDIAPRDDKGNFITGEAVLEDTTDCYVHSERSTRLDDRRERPRHRRYARRACSSPTRAARRTFRRSSQRLKQSNRKEQEQHLRNYRPWGYFETLNIGPRFQVKLLHVKPGGKLSMQMHHHRSEHWIVVQGTAQVVIGERRAARARERERLHRRDAVAPARKPRQSPGRNHRGADRLVSRRG